MSDSSIKRILVLSANPKKLPPSRLDEEIREIEAGLTRAKKRNQFELRQQWAISHRDIQRAILDFVPHIVHFAGRGEGMGLALENETGSTQLISTEALANLFELFVGQVECVLLNTCYSEIQAEAIARHIPYVIGASHFVDDRSALEFAIGFYDALGAGNSVEFAYKFGCNNIRMAGISEDFIPILKKRSEIILLPENHTPERSIKQSVSPKSSRSSFFRKISEFPPSSPLNSNQPFSQREANKFALEAKQDRRQQFQKFLESFWITFPVCGTIFITSSILRFRSGDISFNTAFREITLSIIIVFLLCFLIAILKILKYLLDKILDKIETKLEQRAESFAEWISGRLDSLLTQLWWKLTSNLQGEYYQTLIYVYRSYRPKGLKTSAQVIPDLDSVFVPLRLTNKSPERITAVMLQKHNSSGNLSIWDFLAEVNSEAVYQRMAIIGPPGSGKTTLLEYVTLVYAQHRQPVKVPKLIPILLYLRKISDVITDENSPDLAQLISEQVEIFSSSYGMELIDWFDNKLKTGNCLVMLDGLDEVAFESQRKKVSAWVDRQMREYPKAKFILTSRPFGYRSAQLEEARIALEVQQFNQKQIDQFLNQWYLQNEILYQARKADLGVHLVARRKATDLINRIRNYPPLSAMAVNPLLLTMIATVHNNRGALPGSRVELYAEICDVLLIRRQEAKNIFDPIKMKVAQKQSVLQVLALELMKRKIREFSIQTAKEIIQERLAAVAGTEIYAEKFLEHVEQISGLLVERERGLYEFVHLTFQEYLAALQIKQTNQEQLLINALLHQEQISWWAETIRLYSAWSDTTNLIRAALQIKSVSALALASECLEEGLSVHPNVRKNLEDEVAKLAEVKLSRRFNNLLRLDERVEIDLTHITCSEYQIFINERYQLGQYYKPDHLQSDHLQVANSNNPIIGVRAGDAEEFCCWLSHRYCNQPYIYRLPTLAEAQENSNSVEKLQVGSWCIDTKQNRVISGIDSHLEQLWKKSLVHAFLNDISPPFKERLNDLIVSFDPFCSQELSPPSTIAREISDIRNLAGEIAYTYGRKFGRNCPKDLDDAIGFAQFLDEEYSFIIDLDFSRSHQIDVHRARLYFISACLFLDLLSTAYRTVFKDKRVINTKKLTREMCEILSNRCFEIRRDVFKLYTFFALIDERQLGRVPAWEGIRIVREKRE